MLNFDPELIKPIPGQSLTYAYLLGKYGLTMTWEEAAKELGVYWENIRKLCKRGDIAAEKVGKSWVLTTRAIADFIDHGSISKRAERLKHAQKQTKRQKMHGYQKYVTL